MGDRISEIILLCEDDPQEKLVRRYLERCGFRTLEPNLRVRNASSEVYGGGINWVLAEFPKELEACRKRHNAFANTRLVVVVDADDHSVAQRRAHLKTLVDADPVAVLIPKRHIETWIRFSLGQAVNENDGYKHPKLSMFEIKRAANQIYGWARGNPTPEPTYIDSLRVALPEFRKLC